MIHATALLLLLLLSLRCQCHAPLRSPLVLSRHHSQLTMDKYVKLGKVGEGAHGVVYKARLVQPLIQQPLPATLSTLAQAQHDAAAADELKQPPPPHFDDSKQPTIPPATPDRSQLKRKHDELSTPTTALATTLTLRTPTPLSSISSFNFSASSQPPPQPSHTVPADGIVAIKKIRLRNSGEGLSMEAIRELKLLSELHHDCVVRVYDMFNHNSNVNVVMDFMGGGDLEGVVRCEQLRIREADRKRYVYEITRALAYIHSRWVMHRDLKPGNVLLDKGRVKLADFGLAKLYGSPDRRFSPQACTMWYRSPELLFGSTSYGPSMDMWSLGCIMAELVWRRPLFAGPESELAQLQRIFAVLGTPQQAGWTDVECLPEYVAFDEVKGARPMRELFSGLEKAGCELLSGLLQLDPRKRLSAAEVLKHDWFRTGVEMTPIDSLPQLPVKSGQS